MAERDRSAVHVHFVRIQFEHLDYRQRLRGEGFVQFDDRDVVERQAGEPQSFRNRIYRTNAHLFRRASGSCISDKSRDGLRPKFFGFLFGHHDGGRGAIGHL